MGNLIGIPTGVAVAGAGGSSWKPSDVKDIIEGIKTLYTMAKGGNDGNLNATPQVFSNPQQPPQKCTIETAVENLYALCQQMVNTGHGQDKLASLIDIPNLTINDALHVLGKAIGR